MENFNEEEIQKKIEEKRKRFIENAHRALGFYDQNIIPTSEERLKKKAEEGDANKGVRRYDEEPAKPLILAASHFPENVKNSPEKQQVKQIQDTQVPFEEEKEEISNEEDSLTAAEKEMESKLSSQATTTKAETSNKSVKNTNNEHDYEEKKQYDEMYDETYKDSNHYIAPIANPAKTKKQKKFIVNTRH